MSQVKWLGKHNFHWTEQGDEEVYDPSASRNGRSEGVHERR